MNFTLKISLKCTKSASFCIIEQRFSQCTEASGMWDRQADITASAIMRTTTANNAYTKIIYKSTSI